jgi:hypothetical protein
MLTAPPGTTLPANSSVFFVRTEAPSMKGSASQLWRAVEHASGVFEELNSAVEVQAVEHVEPDVGVAVVDALLPVLPVITGKTTTRYRSTRPAWSNERQRLRLPIVRIGLVPFCFMSRTAWIASPLISSELAHDRGARNDEGEHDLGRLRELGQGVGFVGYSSRRRLRGEAGHEPVRLRTHQQRVVALRLFIEPTEVLGG